MMMPAGRYYVGDLCYVMSDADWSDICELTFRDGKSIDGEFTLADGRKIATYRTKWGDGEYYSNIGTVHCVDSGSIGCILESDINIELDDSNLSYVGVMMDFEKPFVTSSHEGIIQIGFLEIDTDPVFDEDY
jgi:hypothetical protein